MEPDQVEAEAGRVFPDRNIDSLIAPEGFALRENTRISVDPRKKILVELEAEVPRLVDRFSEFTR
jgi:hypothetical protein